jgi:anaerobic sulfite reductase subunit B
MNEYIPRKVKILNFLRETPDIVNIRAAFRCEHGPGEFVMVGLPGIGEAPISISSCSGDYIDLHIREIGTVTKALGKLKKGGYMFVRGPYGEGYPMPALKNLNLVLIGGGCGVAPLRGVVEYVEKHRQEYGNVTLFFGYTSPKDILFRKDIEKWKKQFHLYMSVDRNPRKETCFNARTGFVTELVKKEQIISGSTAALICGPPVMMQIAIGELRKKGFEDSQIYISTERLMDCGLGLCGHCMIHGKYSCLDGPVFRYDQLNGIGE